MKFSVITTAVFALGVAATPTKRQGSKSWAGTSNYFVQSMSNSDQQSYLSQLASDGVKVIRLWVSNQPGGGSCVKGSLSQTGCPHFEETIGEYNYETLDLLDQTLVYLQDNGMKAIISPHDANLLNGPNGNDIYGQTYGSGYFYEQQEAISAFDNRISAILNYEGVHSGRVWKDWTETIMAFNLQNEPFAAESSKCQLASAEEWICGRSAHMRDVLGEDSPIQVASGGFGGDISHGCTFVGMNCEKLDIASVHRYAGAQGNNGGQWSAGYSDWINQANGKLVNLEEWGVDTSQLDPSSEFPANTRDMNSAGLPWVYWQLLPPKVCDVNDNDPFGFYIDSGVPYAEEVQAANEADCPQSWAGIV